MFRQRVDLKKKFVCPFFVTGRRVENLIFESHVLTSTWHEYITARTIMSINSRGVTNKLYIS